MDNKTFTETLSRKLNIDKSEVDQLIGGFCDVIVAASDEGDSVAIPAFGTFETKKRMEREGIHPSTGKKLLLPPKVTLMFKPSSILKQKFK